MFNGTGKGYHRQNLCVLEKLELELLSGTVNTKEREAIRLTLQGVGAQAWSPDPNDSINYGERQLSTRRWGDIEVDKLEVSFLPGQWKLPDPPAGFLELLERLEKA